MVVLNREKTMVNQSVSVSIGQVVHGQLRTWKVVISQKF